ncbi:hypothetical protein LC605_06760 [Nostoc sp. CHAB 5836]|uniref:hypothetical protein n=1 Tax=Nostoc sp. CHAB 5836 TaxID=2780404 RepID=UPI001E42DA74|nr:hypothetical protein [Nostoc sp. CHAB 5836]MCC5614776.1 hypothetical protein [Nostoc sp. CHAB 5836]
MSQIKILDLDNASSLSELGYEDINIVRGGFVATLAATKNVRIANRVRRTVLKRTGNIVLANAASLSTSD